MNAIGWRPTYISPRTYANGHFLDEGWYPYNPHIPAIDLKRYYDKRWKCALECKRRNGQPTFREFEATA